MVSENPDAYEWDWITVSEFMEEFEILQKQRFDARQIGKTLDILGYETKRMKQGGHVDRRRYLPHKLY